VPASFGHVAILGLGLIGGSIAAGIRERQLAERITAFDQNAVSLKHALDIGLVDAAAISAKKAIVDTDLVVVAVPVLAMERIFGDLRSAFGRDDVIVTDVGSVKCQVCDFARAAYGELPPNFVPGHPIAGSEHHGVDAADAGLFRRHKVILTPTDATDAGATAAVRGLWEGVGAQVDEMDPEHHDIILAQTSHLPHLLAFALVDTLSSGGDSLEIFEYAAGGFRDFSRIAASDPIMWRDVFRTNAGPVLEVLDRFSDRLDEMRTLIRDGKTQELSNILARSKAARDHFTRLIERRHSEDPRS